ncbi:hypothetical protein PRZ48_004244 [Zasmidium cellare]|uniref:Major facilitator superfamily (MFS) profile domain-containing protein n=1 Tax=Zasmidium cellare TaxID=395010 RepID=A0ABR0E157_ZASCE|nr:hypothetical protein PRZ48_015300 [Zasmidium cellare]KAK4494995.1 hypothetical protein PRZ48_014351 [Zasmidium cellare]KAK4503329.1 hypothetical protein PRZ48_004244 [Zasmidium cellare]
MEKADLDQEHVEKVNNFSPYQHQDAVDHAGSETESKVSVSTFAAVGFLGFTFQSSLTFTVLFVFPVITPIALELSGSTANSNWLASGWSLSGSIAFAIAGQLSDYLGRRWIIMTGQILLIVGHIVGATAQSLNQCIAAMAILGFGTGTTFVLYPAISEILPNKHRPLGLAWTEANLLPFTTLGPFLARLLVKHASWRWIFILGAITGIVALLGTTVFYFPPARPIPELTRWQILGQLDWLGIFLYTAGLTLFLLGLGWGGTTYPWVSAEVLTLLCIGGCLFVALIVWDLGGWVQRPLFPRRLMRMFRKYTSLLLVIFVTGVVYFTLTALMPLQIQYTLTEDPVMAGIYNIPGGFGGAAGGVLLGGLIAKLGHVHWQLAAGVACQTIFTALQAVCRPGDTGMLLVFQFFANVPFAWITLACYVTAGLHVPQEDLGLALGLVGTSRFLGSAVGTTIYSQILYGEAATSVSDRVGEAVAGLGFSAAEKAKLINALQMGTVASLKLATETLQQVQIAYSNAWSDAFRITWLATIPFGVIAFVIALCVRDPSALFTSETATHMERERRTGRRHTEE